MSTSIPGANRSTARAAWLKVHLYIGLFAGALLALLAATGCILVFGEQVDNLLNPQLAVSDAGTERVSSDAVIAAVEHRYGLRPYYLEAPTEGGPYVAFIRGASGRSTEVNAVRVDPADGRILGNRRWGGYFVSFIRKLHTDLFLGESGAYIVGGVSLLSLASILTGVYLWWPRAGAVRSALTFHRRRHAAAQSFEIHRICGFYLAGVLCVIVSAGTYLALPGPFTAAVGALSPVTPWPVEVASTRSLPDAQPLALDEVERVVKQYAPGAVITGYQLPEVTDESYVIYYRDLAEPYSKYGRSTLWLDQYDGRILDSREYLRLRAADRYLLSQVLLHNGQILGLPGQWLAFVAGIAITVMYGTGLSIWWTRRGRARASTAKTA